VQDACHVALASCKLHGGGRSTRVKPIQGNMADVSVAGFGIL
jgi:hypothetical protein